MANEKVRLLSEEECDRLECYRPTAYEGANLANLARWAREAHALMRQLHWYPDARALLADIEVPTDAHIEGQDNG